MDSDTHSVRRTPDDLIAEGAAAASARLRAILDESPVLEYVEAGRNLDEIDAAIEKLKDTGVPVTRPPEDAIAIEECRSRADFEKLDPRVYAKLVGTSASMLDLLVLQAEMIAILEVHRQAIEDVQKAGG